MLQPDSSMTVHQSTRVSPDVAADIARRLIEVNQDYNALSQEKQVSPYVRKGLLNELLERVESIMSEDIPQPSAYNLAGRIAYDLALFPLAKDYFQRSTKLDPEKSTYSLNLGNALCELENYTAANNAFKRALDLDRRNLPAFMGIAFCLMQTGQYDKAFLHYKTILSYGYSDHLIQHHLCECIQQLHCDRFEQQTEDLLLYLFKSTVIDTTKLLPFALQLLTLKYQLDSEDCVLDIDTLINDPLLIHMLETGVVADVCFEELVTQLRLSILTEATINVQLRDQLIPCAVALGVYASHTDYALVVSEQEEQALDIIKQQTTAEIGYQKAVIENIAGALVVLGMYEALYVQPFSFDLLAYDLEDWPVGMQSMINASLYELSREHQARYELFGQTMTELLNNGVTRASKRWKPINPPKQVNFIDTLRKHIAPDQPPKNWQNKTVRVLLLACGSGEKAYTYATQFTNIEVLAADTSQVDMAYAHAQVKGLEIQNLQYAIADYKRPPSDIEKFDYIEFGEDFDFNFLNDWLKLLEKDGVVRMCLPSATRYEHTSVLSDLIKARGMQPSLENIRLLRNSIMLEKSSPLWEKILSNLSFYSGSGCRDLIFENNLRFFDHEKSYQLLKSAGLSTLAPVARQQTQGDKTQEPIEVFATISAA